LFFLTSKFRPQLIGNGFGHLTLDGKDVSQSAIKGLCPEM
jgi:hypothetical protein